MNRICLTGRVIADPELRMLGERVVATVPVSVNRPYKRKDAPYPESDVFRVDVWGSRGESLVNHVEKGAHIWVSGRVELRKAEGNGFYVDVRDGEWGFVGARPNLPDAEEEVEVEPAPKTPARSGKK
jgi:single-stranded DNA-binding protein